MILDAISPLHRQKPDSGPHVVSETLEQVSTQTLHGAGNKLLMFHQIPGKFQRILTYGDGSILPVRPSPLKFSLSMAMHDPPANHFDFRVTTKLEANNLGIAINCLGLGEVIVEGGKRCGGKKYVWEVAVSLVKISANII